LASQGISRVYMPFFLLPISGVVSYVNVMVTLVSLAARSIASLSYLTIYRHRSPTHPCLKETRWSSDQWWIAASRPAVTADLTVPWKDTRPVIFTARVQLMLILFLTLPPVTEIRCFFTHACCTFASKEHRIGHRWTVTSKKAKRGTKERAVINWKIHTPF